MNEHLRARPCHQLVPGREGYCGEPAEWLVATYKKPQWQERSCSEHLAQAARRTLESTTADSVRLSRIGNK